jgi:hypothetical protein
MSAVFQANNEGIGCMEQFKYPQAVSAFENVVGLAPDWLPGRINLAIALLNTNTEQNLRLARDLFEQVLKEDPKSPFAHFGIGTIIRHEGKPEERAAGIAHFKAVVQIDPADAASWYWLGTLQPAGSQEATACYRRASELDPELAGAIYGLAMNLRQKDPSEAARAMAEYQALRDTRFDADTRGNTIATKYGEMGRYSEVIGKPQRHDQVRNGPLPLFEPLQGAEVRLAAGARWAKKADLGTSVAAEIRRGVQARFGGTLVVLDYNRDGRPDLFLLGAVVDHGIVRDLLLRNDGGNRFTDVTEEAGLAEPRESLGCCVADVDNDGYPDLFITGIGRQWLFRNSVNGRFQDITSASGLDVLHGVCLGAALVDLDQDGDLDLVVAEYAATPEQALQALASIGADQGRFAIFINAGEAPALESSSRQGKALLRPRFLPIFQDSLRIPAFAAGPVATAVASAMDSARRVAVLGGSMAAVGMAVSDLDMDRDLDLLLLADGKPGSVLWNDRLLRFHRTPLPASILAPGRYNGALVFDSLHRGRSDVLIISRDEPPRLLLTQTIIGTTDPARWFESGIIDSPPLLQAQAVDIDLDGWTDVVGLSANRRPVLLHNIGQRLVQAVEALGNDTQWPRDLMAIHVADFDGDGMPDFVVWSESAGLQFYHGRSNGNQRLALELTGRRTIEPGGVKVRTNADAFGVWAVAQAAELWTGAELTTHSAGLGQSNQSLLLGLGRHSQADVLRLRWPDGVWQAELHLPTGQVHRIAETNRKETSCPILFAWDGHRFQFVTDFLGAGSIGEPSPFGGHRPPRPEESVKIEPGQLVPNEGRYVLTIAEPMDETTYLDRIELVAIDHPADVRVYPDERFVDDRPFPSQDLVCFRQHIYPVQARDHKGRDVTAALWAWDRRTVDDFPHRSWLGFAEEHWVELNFADQLSKFGPDQRLFLCLVGWTDYPYPESIWAAAQAGVAPQGPILERKEADGTWRGVVESTGFPAGLPRMMMLEVTGKLGGSHCVLRLRTNLEIYWDQILIAPAIEVLSPCAAARMSGTCRTMRLDLMAATLSARPCPQEYSPDGRQPTLYDYDQTAAVPVSRLSGNLTRYGDVCRLLQDVDDRFVIFGAGDALELQFDARHLPGIPSGWTRSFVLRTWGYCKDCSPFTDCGETVEPLPFRAMRDYPYGDGEHYPADAFHDDYLKRYQTRWAGLSRYPGR